MVIEHKQINFKNKMVFEKAVLKAPFKINNPMPDEACFLYVVEGNYEVKSAISREKLKAHDAILMKCGLYLSEWLSSSTSNQCQAIAVHLYPDVLKSIYEDEIPDFIKQYRKRENPTNMYTVSGDKLIDNYISSMMFYFENPQLVDEELIKIKVKELILLLVKTEKADSVMQLISSLFSPKEYSFREIIESNLFTNISLEELAQMTNLSLSSFKRTFGKTFDDSPAHYLKMKKIERAAKLLEVSGKRISDIAYDCGFSSLAHFTKSFTDFYKKSPSQFRLSQKGKSLT